MTKRDNEYYARRLQKDYPQTWGDFQAGIYKTLAEARRAADLGGTRTRLQELKNAWRKASDKERDAFLAFLDAEGVTLALHRPTPAPAPAPKSAMMPMPTPAPRLTPAHTAGSITSAPTTGHGSTFARDGYLTTEAKDRINRIIGQRGLRGHKGNLKLGIIMREMNPPFSPLDASLEAALTKGRRLSKDLLDALERWVTAQSGL